VQISRVVKNHKVLAAKTIYVTLTTSDARDLIETSAGKGRVCEPGAVHQHFFQGSEGMPDSDGERHRALEWPHSTIFGNEH